MEIITDFPPIFFVIVLVLGIISVCMISMKQFLDNKHHEDGRKGVLKTRIKKMEFALNNILERTDEIDIFLRNREFDKIELEVLAIKGIAQHQLGHMKYFRWLLK